MTRAAVVTVAVLAVIFHSAPCSPITATLRTR